MIFDLAKDFSHALAALPQDHPRRRILTLLEEAIRRDIHPPSPKTTAGRLHRPPPDDAIPVHVECLPARSA